MNLKDPKVVKILLGVVVVGLLSYVYFGTTVLPFGYQVRKARITTLEQEYSKLNADLEKARKTVGRLAQLEAEYDRLHEQWLDARELLPEEHEMPDLLRKVTTAGNKAGVEFMLFQPTPVEIKTDYKAHPVKIKVRGGYHQLGIFLSRLANMDRIINVSSLDVTTAKGARGGRRQDDSRHTVVASFTLTAHTLIKGAGDETDAE
ncbi:MAG: type 4a pilus biogenesis protein PilO [Candidatus Krumholzibacteriia bacterium]